MSWKTISTTLSMLFCRLSMSTLWFLPADCILFDHFFPLIHEGPICVIMIFTLSMGIMHVKNVSL